MEEILKLFFDNKEWISNNVILIIFFVFIFVLYKIISMLHKYFTKEDKVVNSNTVNGNNNRTAQNYNEDKSTHIYNTYINKNNKIDYNRFKNLTLCASGDSYCSPCDGVYYVQGIRGSFCVNDQIEEPIFPEGKQIHVQKGDIVKIKYKIQHQEQLDNENLRFYYYKENSDD